MNVVIIVLAILAGLTAIGILHNLGEAFVARIRSGTPHPGALGTRVDDLEQRVDEAETALRQLSEAEDRLADMEERMEFAERLLQQLRERERLMPGGEQIDP